MKQNETNFTPKTPKIFSCIKCDFKCCNKKDYERHLLTRKHKMKQNETNFTPKNPTTICDICNIEFNSRTTLWRHKKKCNNKESIDMAYMTEKIDASLVMELIKQNKELQQQLVFNNTITNNTTNNNQFNINMFLNETCKNAMNLSDFIERIEISHDDLENNAQLGFVNGMTKILMDNLKLLTIHERPIHCTDVKRETLYVKDEDVWDKKHSNEKLENAIQEVSRKSLKSLIDWKKTNPDYDDLDSEFSKKSIYMQQHSSGLCQKESFYPKIIHNLAKENSITQLKN